MESLLNRKTINLDPKFDALKEYPYVYLALDVEKEDKKLSNYSQPFIA